MFLVKYFFKCELKVPFEIDKTSVVGFLAVSSRGIVSGGKSLRDKMSGSDSSAKDSMIKVPLDGNGQGQFGLFLDF